MSVTWLNVYTIHVLFGEIPVRTYVFGRTCSAAYVFGRTCSAVRVRPHTTLQYHVGLIRAARGLDSLECTSHDRDWVWVWLWERTACGLESLDWTGLDWHWVSWIG